MSVFTARARRLSVSESTPPLTDHEAAVGIRAGDRATFDALFDATYEPLCRVAERYVRSSAVAEEIVQDAFLALWRRRGAIDPVRSIRLYLLQAVRNRALNTIRHAKVVDAWQSHAGSLPTTGHVPSPEAELERAELSTAIAHVVAQLPPRTREVFLLSRGRGLSYVEIAHHCGIAIKTVEAQMARAFRELRARLAAYREP
jgi:RNA polymerase sigma-70 factor, ECF subfamily